MANSQNRSMEILESRTPPRIDVEERITRTFLQANRYERCDRLDKRTKCADRNRYSSGPVRLAALPSIFPSSYIVYRARQSHSIVLLPPRAFLHLAAVAAKRLHTPDTVVRKKSRLLFWSKVADRKIEQAALEQTSRDTTHTSYHLSTRVEFRILSSQTIATKNDPWRLNGKSSEKNI